MLLRMLSTEMKYALYLCIHIVFIDVFVVVLLLLLLLLLLLHLKKYF
jgi:hypothetical protein